MTEKPTVQQALAAIMADVRKVAKTGTNTAQHFNFRGIDAVLNAVGPALRDHGVVIRPEVTDLRYERVVVGDRKAAVQVLAFLTYTFVGPAGDEFATRVVGEAIDYGDKGVSKAMSVALRTALIQTLALPTGDPEPDTQTYERAAPPPRQQQAPPKQSAYTRGSPRDKPAGQTRPEDVFVDKGHLAALHIRLGEYGIGGAANRDAALAYMADVIGHELGSSKELSVAEFRTVMDRLADELRQGTDVPPDDPTLDPEYQP